MTYEIYKFLPTAVLKKSRKTNPEDAALLHTDGSKTQRRFLESRPVTKLKEQIYKL